MHDEGWRYYLRIAHWGCGRLDWISPAEYRVMHGSARGWVYSRRFGGRGYHTFYVCVLGLELVQAYKHDPYTNTRLPLKKRLHVLGHYPWRKRRNPAAPVDFSKATVLGRGAQGLEKARELLRSKVLR